MSLYDLNEERALKIFEYPKEFSGMVFDESRSIISYIFGLILAFLFFGLGLSISTILPYVHYSGKVDYGFLKGRFILEYINLENVFSKILIKTHIPLLIFLLLLLIYFFVMYIKYNKKDINKFHVKVQQGMLLFMVVYYIQFLCLSFSIQPQIGLYTNIVCIAVLIMVIYQFCKGYKEYNQTLHSDNKYKDSNVEKLIKLVLLFTPILIFIRQVHLAYVDEGFSIRNIEGLLGFIILIAFPYLLAIFGKSISKTLLEFHTKHFYFTKYPEAFRIQAGKSKEEFYGVEYKTK